MATVLRRCAAVSRTRGLANLSRRPPRAPSLKLEKGDTLNRKTSRWYNAPMYICDRLQVCDRPEACDRSQAWSRLRVWVRFLTGLDVVAPVHNDHSAQGQLSEGEEHAPKKRNRVPRKRAILDPL